MGRCRDGDDFKRFDTDRVGEGLAGTGSPPGEVVRRSVDQEIGNLGQWRGVQRRADDQRSTWT